MKNPNDKSGAAFSTSGDGLTKREYIAAMVFAAMVREGSGEDTEAMTSLAVSRADALLRKLRETPPG